MGIHHYIISLIMSKHLFELLYKSVACDEVGSETSRVEKNTTPQVIIFHILDVPDKSLFYTEFNCTCIHKEEVNEQFPTSFIGKLIILFL